MYLTVELTVTRSWPKDYALISTLAVSVRLIQSATVDISLRLIKFDLILSFNLHNLVDILWQLLYDDLALRSRSRLIDSPEILGTIALQPVRLL